MTSKEDISGAPLSVRAVFLRPDELHMWALGVKSLIFCDNRLVLSHPEVRMLGGVHTRRRGSPRGRADVLGVVSIFTCCLRRELGHSAAAGASSTGASETWAWTSLLMLLWTRIALWRRTSCVCRVPR